MIGNECGPPTARASTVRPQDVRVHKKSVEKNVDRFDHLGDRKHVAVIARAANLAVPIVRVATQFDNTEEVQVGNRRHNPTSWQQQRSLTAGSTEKEPSRYYRANFYVHPNVDRHPCHPCQPIRSFSCSTSTTPCSTTIVSPPLSAQTSMRFPAAICVGAIGISSASFARTSGMRIISALCSCSAAYWETIRLRMPGVSR